MCLTDMTRPRVFVELGTYYGVSYCSFCQAVKELGCATRCTAVDTWRGDPQGGVFGQEVLDDLRRHHDPLYGGFSRLMQSEFSDALAAFEDGSVDLLHIDGFHTYDAVRQDYETWLPKMSTRGVIIFHDISVREKDFGVWKLWEELRREYPGRNFEFEHSYGLGLIATGTEYPQALQTLFDAPAEEAAHIRAFFQRLGAHLTALQEAEMLRGQNAELSSALRKMYGMRVVRLARLFSEEGAGAVIRRGLGKMTHALGGGSDRKEVNGAKRGGLSEG
jgi:hypothetical protein